MSLDNFVCCRMSNFDNESFRKEEIELKTQPESTSSRPAEGPANKRKSRRRKRGQNPGHPICKSPWASPWRGRRCWWQWQWASGSGSKLAYIRVMSSTFYILALLQIHKSSVPRVFTMCNNEDTHHIINFKHTKHVSTCMCEV